MEELSRAAIWQENWAGEVGLLALFIKFLVTTLLIVAPWLSLVCKRVKA